jgi:hypothetical protein
VCSGTRGAGLRRRKNRFHFILHVLTMTSHSTLCVVAFVSPRCLPAVRCLLELYAAGGRKWRGGQGAGDARGAQRPQAGAYHLLTIVHVFTPHLSCFNLFTTTGVTMLIAA